MLVIRLFRIGKKNQPSFKIVVTDKKNPPRGGRFVEQVGAYNPLTKEKNFNADRIKHWLSVGAKPSATVYNMLVGEKIIEGKKIDLHKKPEKKDKFPEAPTAGAPSEAESQESAKREKQVKQETAETQKNAETPEAPQEETPALTEKRPPKEGAEEENSKEVAPDSEKRKEEALEREEKSEQ